MRLPLTRPVATPEPAAFETKPFQRLEGFVSGRDLFVILIREAAPTDSDWNRYMAGAKDWIERQPDKLAGTPTLVLSDGGAPNTMQRTRLTEIQEGTSTRTAVALLSDSPLVRGASRAIALFNPRFKVFKPVHFTEALDHLGVPRASATIVKSHILDTERLLGGQRLRVVRAIFARSAAE
ncbi:MAG: hypothetical protein ABI134_23760 [Byssovorax sp.]